MSKISIEQQVAELTPEQRNSMGKIYKSYVVFLMSIVVLGLLLTIGLFAYFSIQEGNAKKKHDAIQAAIELNNMNNRYDLSLYDESLELLDKYYDMKQMKPLSLVIGSAIVFIGVIVLNLMFKKKYPYFSEAKYTYIKKQEKNS